MLVCSSSSLTRESLRFLPDAGLAAAIFVVEDSEGVLSSLRFRGPLLMPGRPRPRPLPEVIVPSGSTYWRSRRDEDDAVGLTELGAGITELGGSTLLATWIVVSKESGLELCKFWLAGVNDVDVLSSFGWSENPRYESVYVALPSVYPLPVSEGALFCVLRLAPVAALPDGNEFEIMHFDCPCPEETDV